MAAAWDLSCVDWEQRLRRGESLVPALPLFSEPADSAVAVFNKLRLADVEGTPAMAEAGDDWFRDIVRALFGSYDPVARERLIRELFLLVPKKNNKTTGAALLMLTALLLNVRPRADFLLTGPVQDTADTAFSAAHGAIELDPVLKKKLLVREHERTIVHRETKAELQIATFDLAILTGRKLVGGLVDEIHVLGKNARAAKAMVQLRGGMQPFPEAFLINITTQSDDPPAGVFADELKRARDIRDGKVRDDRMLPVLYEFPRAMQESPARPWRDPANWAMVNPNAGRSVSIDRLEQAFKVEEAKGERAVRIWASQHLNIQIGVAINANAWSGSSHWDGAVGGPKTLEELIERSEVVAAGIDGGGLDDLLGFGAIGRETGTGRWLHWGRAWAHRSVLELRQEIAPALLGFEADGDLVIVDDDSEDDVQQAADLVEQIEESGLLDRVGVDQAGIGAIVDAIVDRKIEFERIAAVPQGWRLVGAIKTAERKLAAKTLVHGGGRMMAWSVGNARAEVRSNAVVITKQIAGVAKIDPLMALFNCVALMALNPKPRKKRYELLFV